MNDGSLPGPLPALQAESFYKGLLHPEIVAAKGMRHVERGEDMSALLTITDGSIADGWMGDLIAIEDMNVDDGDGDFMLDDLGDEEFRVVSPPRSDDVDDDDGATTPRGSEEAGIDPLEDAAGFDNDSLADEVGPDSESPADEVGPDSDSLADECGPDSESSAAGSPSGAAAASEGGPANVPASFEWGPCDDSPFLFTWKGHRGGNTKASWQVTCRKHPNCRRTRSLLTNCNDPNGAASHSIRMRLKIWCAAACLEDLWVDPQHGRYEVRNVEEHSGLPRTWGYTSAWTEEQLDTLLGFADKPLAGGAA